MYLYIQISQKGQSKQRDVRSLFESFQDVSVLAFTVARLEPLHLFSWYQGVSLLLRKLLLLCIQVCHWAFFYGAISTVYYTIQVRYPQQYSSHDVLCTYIKQSGMEPAVRTVLDHSCMVYCSLHFEVWIPRISVRRPTKQTIRLDQVGSLCMDQTQ